MRAREGIVVFVLGNDRKSVLNGSGCDERIGKLDQALQPRRLTISYKPRPGNHHGLADRNRFRTASQSQGVRSTCPRLSVRRVEHAKLELSDCHHRHYASLGQVTEWPAGLAGDEDGGVEEPVAG